MIISVGTHEHLPRKVKGLQVYHMMLDNSGVDGAGSVHSKSTAENKVAKCQKHCLLNFAPLQRVLASSTSDPASILPQSSKHEDSVRGISGLRKGECQHGDQGSLGCR